MKSSLRASFAFALLAFPCLLFLGIFSGHSRFNDLVNRFLTTPAPSRSAVASEFASFSDAGTAGMAVVEYNVTNVLISLLQGITIPFILLTVGFSLLKRITADDIMDLPLSVTIGLSALVGAVAVSGVSLLFHGIPYRLGISAVLVGITGLIAMNEFRSLRELFRQAYSTQILPMSHVLGIALVVYLSWLLTIPLSPYPSILVAGQGDLPAYCTTAMNVLNGRGFAEDYFVADFYRGAYGYLSTSSALPVLCLSFFYRVFGGNVITVFILFAFFGVLTAYLLTDFIRRFTGNPLWTTLTACLLLLRPLYSKCMGFGVISNLAALSFSLLIASYGATLKNRATTAFLRLLPITAAFAIRPESVVLALLMISAETLWVYSRLRLKSVLKWGIPCLLVGGAGLFVLRLPVPASSSIRSLSLFHVQYQPGQNEFSYRYQPWWKYNLMLCQTYFKGAVPPRPQDLFSVKEALAHPTALARFVLRQLRKVNSTLGGLIVGGVFWGEALLFPFLVVPALLLLPGRLRWIAAAHVVYIAILPSLNIAATDRHFYPAAINAQTLFLFCIPRFAWWPKAVDVMKSRWALNTVIFLATVYFIFNTQFIIQSRRDERSTFYVDTIRDFARISKDSLVVTSYPQLFACMTGSRKMMGGTFLLNHLPDVTKTFHPDYVLLDHLRELPIAPYYFTGCPFAVGLNYRPDKACSGKRYTLFKRVR